MGELKKLAVFAQTQPQAAYSAYVTGLRGRWAFLCRAMKVPEPMFQPLEDIVKSELIPALTCRASPGDTLRRLLALPCRLGGLGLINPVSLCQQYESSVWMTNPLSRIILSRDGSIGDSVVLIRSAKRDAKKTESDAISGSASESLRHVIDVAKEKGFIKGRLREFWDGLCLRYGWTPARVPSHCSCGQEATVAHSLSCPYGGPPLDTMEFGTSRPDC